MNFYQKLIKLIPPRAFGYPRTRETFKSRTGLTFDYLAAAETATNLTLKMLFNPERASRLITLKARDKNSQPGLPYVMNEIIHKNKSNIDFIGFHGQTIFHNAKEKISKQLGDGKLLATQTKKTVIYDFRQNDIKNGGHGAPLTPVFHKLLKKNFKIKNVIFVNIGGIVNITTLLNEDNICLLYTSPSPRD